MAGIDDASLIIASNLTIHMSTEEKNEAFSRWGNALKEGGIMAFHYTHLNSSNLIDPYIDKRIQWYKRTGLQLVYLGETKITIDTLRNSKDNKDRSGLFIDPKYQVPRYVDDGFYAQYDIALSQDISVPRLSAGSPASSPGGIDFDENKLTLTTQEGSSRLDAINDQSLTASPAAQSFIAIDPATFQGFRFQILSVTTIPADSPIFG